MLNYRIFNIHICILLLVLLFTPEANSKSHYERLCADMVETYIIDKGIKEQKIINVFLKIPRHEFIPNQYKNIAYENTYINM